MKQSAGILVYRTIDTGVEVLLAHPGGPFWAKKDTWTIPKGETEEGEDLQAAAFREFKEEMGITVPEGDLASLGSVKQDSTKTNHVWAVQGSPDITTFKSNTFNMEWPPKSGQQQEFPENDRAAWFPIVRAKQKVYKNQQPFFDRLAEHLHVSLEEERPPEQQTLL